MRFTTELIATLGADAQDLAIAVNGAIEDIAAAKLAETRLLDSAGVTLAWKIAALKQSIIHRVLDLAEASLRELAGRHYLSMVILARAVIETIALFNDLCEGLQKAIDAGDLAELDKLVMTTAFAARDRDILSGPEYAAKSILTPIDHLDSKIPGIRKNYDLLSEFAHPNGMGHQHFYGRIDKETFVVRFSRHNVTAVEMGDFVVGALVGLLWMRDQLGLVDAVVAKLIDLKKRPELTPDTAGRS